MKRQLSWFAALAIGVCSPQVFGQDFRPLAANHDHFRKGCSGSLQVTSAGLSFTQSSRKKEIHQWSWSWSAIQELRISQDRWVLVGYDDMRLVFGRDRVWNFEVRQPVPPEMKRLVRERLDRRLIDAAAEAPEQFQWRVSVKRLGLIRGASGELWGTSDGIVFRSTDGRQIRYWRLRDIDNASQSGPDQLTFVVFERSLTGYGGRKSYDFQLKMPLPEGVFDQLWLNIQKSSGLDLNSTRRE